MLGRCNASIPGLGKRSEGSDALTVSRKFTTGLRTKTDHKVFEVMTAVTKGIQKGADHERLKSTTAASTHKAHGLNERSGYRCEESQQQSLGGGRRTRSRSGTCEARSFTFTVRLPGKDDVVNARNQRHTNSGATVTPTLTPPA